MHAGATSIRRALVEAQETLVPLTLLRRQGREIGQGWPGGETFQDLHRHPLEGSPARPVAVAREGNPLQQAAPLEDRPLDVARQEFLPRQVVAGGGLGEDLGQYLGGSFPVIHRDPLPQVPGDGETSAGHAGEVAEVVAALVVVGEAVPRPEVGEVED